MSAKLVAISGHAERQAQERSSIGPSDDDRAQRMREPATILDGPGVENSHYDDGDQ